MRMIFGGICAVLLLFIIIIAWGAWPWSIGEKKISAEVINIEPEEMFEEVENPTVTKVLTWNLGFLYGKGSEGDDYVFREKEFFQQKLNTLIKEIKEWSPDIICLQEVDFGSSRSHGINQAQYLATKAGYPYVAEALSWDANYIPFPYWPIRAHFGHMKSGGAILSRYPILQHTVQLLSKPESQPWWYNLFYLHRYYQKVTLSIGKKEFKLVNVHLEAFDKRNRQEHVQFLTKAVASEGIHIVAGDFNMLPQGAAKKSKFFNDDDYENDSGHEMMSKTGLLEVVPNDIYVTNESAYFTFPAWAPDRRLDYIFYRPELKMMRAEILPSALSDHLPIRASFQIDSPKINPYSQ